MNKQIHSVGALLLAFVAAGIILALTVGFHVILEFQMALPTGCNDCKPDNNLVVFQRGVDIVGTVLAVIAGWGVYLGLKPRRLSK